MACSKYNEKIKDGKAVIQLCSTAGKIDVRMGVGAVKNVFLDDEGFIIFDVEALPRKEVMCSTVKALDIVASGELSDSGEVTDIDILYAYQIDTPEEVERIQTEAAEVFEKLATKMKEEQEDVIIENN